MQGDIATLKEDMTKQASMAKLDLPTLSPRGTARGAMLKTGESPRG